MVDLPPPTDYICDRSAGNKDGQRSHSCRFSLLSSDAPRPAPNLTHAPVLSRGLTLLTQVPAGEPPAPSLTPTPLPAPPNTLPNPPVIVPTPQPSAGSPAPTPTPAAPATTKPATRLSGTVELRADEQSFDTKEQIVTASGNVRIRFRNAIMKADRVEIDLQTRKVVATGNVALKRGEQILRGDRFDYDFGNDRGAVSSASGDVYQPTLERDTSITNPAPSKNNGGNVSAEFPNQTLAEQLERDQPVSRIERRSVTGGVIGGDREIEFQPPLQPTGTITRLRYRADRLEFDGKVLSGNGIRITNDPFSPPELEVRADRAVFKNISPGIDQISADNPRVTIEQSVNLPLVVGSFALGRRSQENNAFGIGYDNDERGGLFFERNFKLANTDQLRWTLSPQYYLQKVIAKDKLFSLESLGIRTNLKADLAPGTVFEADAALTSLEPSLVGNSLRSKLALIQDVNLPSGVHKFGVTSNYRERTFNGTLGFQDIQSSLGVGITSPRIDLGGTGAILDYRAGFQLLNAGTDRVGIGASDGRVTLGRLQLGASLNKSWRIWEGVGPDPNDRATYNFSPVPTVPYLQLNTGINAQLNNYTNGETQSLYGYSVSLQGQIGHFVAPAFDYTGFNIGYAQGFLNGTSPFLFDRFQDTRVVTAGINQQLFGPFRVGVQTSINVDNARPIGTDYYLEYSRRTFSILVRYNPVLQLGTIGFKLNDLDWRGQADPF
jgi:lipopolysaccharide export system protein LptA